MVDSQESSGRGRVLETYGSGTQRVIGWILIVLALLFAGDVFVEWTDSSALRPAAIAILFAVVAWVTSARPLVIAHENGLRIRNFFRDHEFDWTAIDHAELRGELTVFPIDEGKRVNAVAVSGRRPDRPNLAGQYPTPFGGLSGPGARVDSEMDVADRQRPEGARTLQGPPRIDHPAMYRPKRGERSKGLYAADRISQMAHDARERARPGHSANHSSRLAVFEVAISIASLVFLAVAFVI
jgi:Bacterial PH domain